MPHERTALLSRRSSSSLRTTRCFALLARNEQMASSLLALALDPVLASVDTAFVGQLPGSVPLASMALSSSLFGLLFSSCNFFANCATPSERSARREDSTKRWYRNHQIGSNTRLYNFDGRPIFCSISGRRLWNPQRCKIGERNERIHAVEGPVSSCCGSNHSTEWCCSRHR